jgi:AcrR family transcriptional regulator
MVRSKAEIMRSPRRGEDIRRYIVSNKERKMVKAKWVSKSPDIAVRERLLAAATDLFSTKGYSATATREIVAAAGVTKPVLYYYFRNKEGIYLELMRKAFTKFDALLDASRSHQGSATERLLRLCDQVFTLFMENIGGAKLMYSIYYGPPQGAPFFDFDAYFLKFQDTIRRLIKIGIKQGEFQKGSVRDMMWPILGAVSVATDVQLSHREMQMDRRTLARILKLIFQGISARPPRQKGERE